MTDHVSPHTRAMELLTLAGVDHDSAAALLEAPGVDLVGMVGQFGDGTGGWILADPHYGTTATHRRLVVMLPAEEISQT